MQITPIPCLTDNYAYIINDNISKSVGVVDPSESLPIIAFLKKQNLKLNYILNTHHHFDHIGGNEELKKIYNAKVVGFKGDKHRIPGIDITLENNPVFWDFTHERWMNEFELPPLHQNIFITGHNDLSDTLAITEFERPLWIRNQHENIRTMVWTSPDMNTLYFLEKKLSQIDAFSTIWDQSISWLLKTGGEHDNFFRLNKNRFQQRNRYKFYS